MRLLLTGGGTGGHVFPLIAVERRLRKIAEENGEILESYYVGPDHFAREEMAREGIRFSGVLAGKFRRYFSLLTLRDLLIIPVGIIQALFKVWLVMPDVIFSKGGYGSVPVVFAGWLYRIPIISHESDTVVGLANRFNMGFSTRIAVGWPQALEGLYKNRTTFTGNPVREEIIAGNKKEAIAALKLDGSRKIIMALGGSQGSSALNDVLLDVLKELLDVYEVIHQAGDKNFKGVAAEADAVMAKGQEKYYHLYGFLGEKELTLALAAADLVISRAGATSVAEIAAAGKPSILVPLPDSAGGHQVLNAYSYARLGASVVLEQDNLTPNLFLEKIRYLFSREDLLTTMSERAKTFYKPEAARVIAEELWKLGTK